jgi:hypothetical protein
MRIITKASHNFEGVAWAVYDAAFRRQATNLKNWEWGTIDAGLYNETFAGRARIRVRCSSCLSEDHEVKQCPVNLLLGFARTNPLANPMQVGAVQQPRQQQGGFTVELCGLYNKASGNECHFRDCKYAHVCSLCRFGSHPASQCSHPRRVLLPDRT